MLGKHMLMVLVLMLQDKDIQLYWGQPLSELFFMSFANENLEHSIWKIRKLGENDLNVARILPFYNSFCRLVFNIYLEKFCSFLSDGAGINWIVDFVLVDQSFLLIPVHLENETWRAALKWRPSIVTTKFVKSLKTVSCSLLFLR